MAACVLGQMVAAGEALGAERAGEPLLPCVCPVVAGQLIGARKLLVAAWPVTGKGALTWMDESEGKELVVIGLGVGSQGEGEAGHPIRSQSIPVICLIPALSSRG